MVLKTETTTLGGIIARFLARGDLSPKGRAYYQNIFSKLDWFSRKHGWPEAAGITRDHVRDFVDYVATEKRRWPQAGRGTYKAAAPATVYHYTKAVKTLFNWAEAEEYLSQNPVARLKVRPPHYKEVRPYTDDEVRAMLEVCEDDIRFGYRYLGIRNKAIISMFISTGLRLEELSNAGLSDFDPRLQQLQVLGKGRKVRVVPINGEARKALRRYLEFRPQRGEALWLTDEGEPMTFYGVRTMVRRLKHRAGVAGGGGAHRFRHYFATRYLEAGGDINSLRLLLGHATLTMALHYSRYVDVRKALAQHDQFDPLDRLYRGAKPRPEGLRLGLAKKRTSSGEYQLPIQRQVGVSRLIR